ncbi:hypothetical protein TanjilG_10909 [Lupinus angustifolius]|uniref:Late embryogenesis abundant protein LEA-2 subgroup domain-containing protein n=1 Tax=Lupinus angustifolius TaxID=3871 RepID=A0A394DG29_LUPAN|nr:PREDICTED: NDR1/HIN1-Like protein 3-like [Lupinus angustifolius]OIW21793.1 hypothetical protein TanjilG_10909 [Lupinus angustifolius]
MSQLNGAYYGPAIPPPPRYYHRSDDQGCCCNCLCGLTRCCCGCIFSIICKILTFVLVLVIIAAVIIWFIVRPNVLKFYVTETNLTEFNYGNNGILDYNLGLNVSIRNPNSRLGVYYDDIEATALYEDVKFGSQSLEPFFQHKKSTRYVGPVFKGQQAMSLGEKQVSKLNKDKDSGVYDIVVKLKMKFRFKFGLIKIGSFYPKIRCDLKVPLKSHNGNGQFETTQCGWDYRSIFLHKD